MCQQFFTIIVEGNVDAAAQTIKLFVELLGIFCVEVVCQDSAQALTSGNWFRVRCVEKIDNN